MTKKLKVTATENDRLIDSTEVAKMMGVSVCTVNNWRAHGRGPDYVRVNSRVVRYKMSAIHRFIEINSTRADCA